MSENNQDRFNGEANEVNGIDELLDRSLEHFRAIEPRPGLEQRLLAHLNDAPAPARLWSWHVALPAAVTVFVAAGALYVALRPTSHQTSPEVATSISIPPEASPTPEVEAVDPPRKPSAPVRPSREPKRIARRTTPQTLPPAPENQEALLLEFLQASAAMPNFKALKEERSAPPREIAGLTVTPLSIEFLPGFDPENLNEGE